MKTTVYRLRPHYIKVRGKQHYSNAEAVYNSFSSAFDAIEAHTVQPLKFDIALTRITKEDWVANNGLRAHFCPQGIRSAFRTKTLPKRLYLVKKVLS